MRSGSYRPSATSRRPRPAASLFIFPPRTRQAWKWIAPAGIVTAGTALAVVLTLQPSATLAQVAAAQTRVGRYTIINTRILNNGQTFKVLTYRDGAGRAIYTDEAGKPELRSVMDGSRSVTIRSFPRFQITDAEIDEPQPLATQDFDVKHLLREGKAFSTKRVMRDGQALDEFESHSKYPGLHGAETYDQTVLADAKTHLPIRSEVFRNNHAWGDVWEYNYGPIPASIFDSNPPKGFKIYDLREERVALFQALKNGPVITVGHHNDVGILFPFEGTTAKSTVHVDGLSEAFQKTWQFIPKPITIAGKSWRLARIFFYPNLRSNVDSLGQLSTTSVEVDGNKVENVRVMNTADTGNLLRPVWPRESR